MNYIWDVLIPLNYLMLFVLCPVHVLISFLVCCFKPLSQEVVE